MAVSESLCASLAIGAATDLLVRRAIKAKVVPVLIGDLAIREKHPKSWQNHLKGTRTTLCPVVTDFGSNVRIGTVAGLSPGFRYVGSIAFRCESFGFDPKASSLLLDIAALKLQFIRSVRAGPSSVLVRSRLWKR